MYPSINSSLYVFSIISYPLDSLLTLKLTFIHFHSLLTNFQSSKATSSSSQVPGGAKTLAKRKATQENQAKSALQNQPTSTRSAGAGGSSSTMLKIYTDEANGFKIDPLVVLLLSVAFIFSVIVLHVLAKLTGKFK